MCPNRNERAHHLLLKFLQDRFFQKSPSSYTYTVYGSCLGVQGATYDTTFLLLDDRDDHAKGIINRNTLWGYFEPLATQNLCDIHNTLLYLSPLEIYKASTIIGHSQEIIIIYYNRILNTYQDR